MTATAVATAVATEASFEMDLPADMGSTDAGPAVLSLHREPPEAADAAELLEGGDAAEADEEIVELDFATPTTAAESTSEGQPAAEPTAEPASATAVTPSPVTKMVTHGIEAHVAAEKRRKAYLREKDVLQEHISALMIEQMKLREQAKNCKKEAEVYIEKLNSLIEAWENPGDDSPLDADADVDAGDSGQEGQALTGGCVADHDDRAATERPRTEPVSQQGEVPSQAGARPAKSEQRQQARYQSVLDAAPVFDLDLPAKLLERLQEAGATTVWRLEKLRGEIAMGREKWPKGVGEAKVTAIEDALMKWMSAHQESWDAPEAVESPDAEAGPLDAEVAAGGAIDPDCEAAVEAVAPAPAPAPTIDDL